MKLGVGLVDSFIVSYVHKQNKMLLELTKITANTDLTDCDQIIIATSYFDNANPSKIVYIAEIPWNTVDLVC